MRCVVGAQAIGCVNCEAITGWVSSERGHMQIDRHQAGQELKIRFLGHRFRDSGFGGRVRGRKGVNMEDVVHLGHLADRLSLLRDGHWMVCVRTWAHA